MRVTAKGRVTIPKEIRDRLGIGPGSEVEFVERNGGVILRKQADPSQWPVPTFEERVASMSGILDTMGMDAMNMSIGCGDPVTTATLIDLKSVSAFPTAKLITADTHE